MHAWAYQNRLGMSSGLQHVVTAGAAKGAAHIDNVAHSVDASQFTNSIDNEQGVLLALALELLHLGAIACFVAIMTGQLGNFFRACSFTRSNNQTGMGILFSHSLKGFQQNFFFARMGGASHNNGVMVL